MAKNTLVKILIIEKDSSSLELISNSLHNESYKIMNTNNEYLAIDIARDEKPDVIILDTMEPSYHGINLCKQLRKFKELEDVVITFLSSNKEDYIQILGLNAGADDYITKPISPRILNRKVIALLRRKRINMKINLLPN